MLSQWTTLSEIDVGVDRRANETIKDDTMPSKRYMLTGTLVFGILAALYAAVLQSLFILQPVMVKLSIWLGLGVYGVLFYHWQNTPFSMLIFPLWIGFSSAWISMTAAGYLFLAMGLLIWIRSGHFCFRSISFRRMGLDFILSYGGVVLISWCVAFFNMPLPWGVLIFWGFQCAYFIPDFGSLKIG
jgi:hypothetical protein